MVTRFPHSSPTTSGAVFRGAGTSCLGDNDDSGKDDACDDPIPAVSDWGVLVLTLLLLTAGTVLFRRPRTVLP
ncbi:MAG: IPTL-CTERM sorting domain-containing protein [Planctomycetes bacterium]|nr:IPTL-CTERM sorting domain-containing protein [Planctomycetota bacterium]